MGDEPRGLLTAASFADRARVGCLSIPAGALVGLLLAATLPWDPGTGTALLAGGVTGLVLWAVVSRGLTLLALAVAAVRGLR
jgi:hypothetical protein